MTALAARTHTLAEAFLAGAFAVAVWGATPAATKLAVLAFDPVSAAVLRTVLGAAVALPLAFLLRLPLPKDGGGWFWLALASAGGFVLCPLLLSFGLARTTTAHAALIIALAPLITGLFAAALARAWPRRAWFVGSALAFLGVALLIGARDSASTGVAAASVLGDLLCLAGVAAAAFGYVAGAKLGDTIGVWSATLWGLSLAGLALLPVVPFLSPGAWAPASAIGWAAVLWLALGSSIVAYAAWYHALRVGGVVRTAPLQFAQPVTGLILAVALMGETLSPALVLAATVILAGIALARR
jgi:drug/metabolite transporter (DMT)-like permease